VRLRVVAGALNHLDLWVLRGIPGVTVGPGFIAGSDAVAVVEAVGDAVSTVRVGDRVVVNAGINTVDDAYVRRGEHPLSPGFRMLGEHLPGTFAERVVVPAANVGAIGDAGTDAEAAAFALSSLTAWRMVHTRARVTVEDHVLIWGIGGGVALAALLLCKRIGATVWVTSGDEEKLARAAALGADDGLLHRGVDVGKVVRERTGKRGVTVVIDSVGTATWAQSLGALGRGGRLVTCGGTSGAVVETDVRRLFWNQWSLLGSTMGTPAEFAEVVTAFRAGWLRLPVDSEWALADAAGAYARLASGAQFGKVVLRVGAA
jgi:NADPH:quinone reductase-like Zn-dependent oxidoreductase